MEKIQINRKHLTKVILLLLSSIILFMFLILKLNKLQLIQRPYIIVALVLSLLLVLSFGLVEYKFKKVEYYYLQLVDFFYLLNLALFLIQVFFMIGFYPVEVDGPSMMPNLYNGEKLIVQALGTPDNGDVVVLRINQGGEKLELVKRVIGKPGDTFYFDLDSNLVLNGKVVKEEYLLDEDGFFYQEPLINTKTNSFALWEVAKIGNDFICRPNDECKIPEDYYFVMGDNRAVSHDSRVFGLVHKDEILGIILYKRISLFKWEKVK